MKKYILPLSVLYLASLCLTNTFYAMEQQHPDHHSNAPQKTIDLEELTENQLKNQVTHLRSEWRKRLKIKNKYTTHVHPSLKDHDHNAELDKLNNVIKKYYKKTQKAISLLHNKFGCVVEKHAAGHYIFSSKSEN